MAILTIKGQQYNLPPLNTGQIKRNWSAFVEVLGKMGQTDPTADLKSTLSLPVEFTNAQSDILLVALKNEYPHITMDDIDTLPPQDLAKAVKELVAMVQRGLSGEDVAAPQEAVAPARGKRSR